MTKRPICCAIIEDDAADTLLLKTFIQKAMGAAWTFKTYEDYESGAKALAEGEINIAFIDLNINGRNGLELIKSAAARSLAFPVIVVSALSDDALQEAAIGAGAYDFLPKDEIDEKTIKRTLRHVFAAFRKEQELRRLAEQARQSSAVKSSFLACMSHDLRTPLNAIIGFSDILKLSAFGPTTRERTEEYAGIISDSARHLLEIINTILDLAKIEQQKYTLNQEWIPLTQFIQDQIKILKPISDEKGIRVRFFARNEFCYLNADPRALRQIFVNIVSNAIKFSQEDSEVAITTCLQQGALRLTITDSGVGMTEPELKKAMTPFGQVTKDPQLARNGTGLGLSIVKALVEEHGARLKIDSRKGIGTRVSAIFPASSVSMPEERQTLSA